MFFSSYETLIIKKFIFSKKTDGFISIFSWFSIIGITIGVAAIIIVMSVMNGFREELTSRLLGINGHLNIYSYNNEITKKEFETLNFNNTSLSISPLTQTQALIISNKNSKGVIMRGYDDNFLFEDHFLNKKLVEGNLFNKSINDVVIGYALANQLKLNIDDQIKIAIPKTDKTILGNIPRFKTLNIIGIINLGMYEYDSNFIFTNKKLANKLLLYEDSSYNQIEIFVDDPNHIEIISNDINNQINDNNLEFYSVSWKETNAAIINALNVEKNVMFLILILIIIVASMNIISGLIIFVKEKNRDIGILKTIGFYNKSLIKVFISIGLIIGLLGTFLGSLLGILFSLNIKKIQLFLEQIFNTSLFSKEVYYLSNLPSKLDKYEILFVILISILICLIATTIPAYRSLKIDPIESIKND